MKTRPCDFGRRLGRSWAAGRRSGRRGLWCRHLSLLLGIALLAGCATVTFKRGASSGAMTADEQACRAATTDDAAYVECLRDRGWLVSGIAIGGADGDVPVTEPPPPERAADAPATDVPAVRIPHAPVGAAAAPTAAATVPVAAPAAARASTTSPPARERAASDPLARVETGSWWKLGGSPAGLDRSIADCVDTLGPAHRPEPGATVVTAGLRACLREAGWYPLGGSTARE